MQRILVVEDDFDIQELFLSCQDQNNIQHPEVHSNDM